MRATDLEFRLRVVILVSIVALGYWSPWIGLWGVGTRATLMMGLALELSRTGLVTLEWAMPAVIVLACLIALKGAILRVWGTAYLGSRTVSHTEMQAGHVLADGPYRFVRNPLYWGTWCMFAAMAFLLPVSGALVAIALTTIFLLRLILGEEAFLRKELGEAYAEYLHRVPRLFPRLRGMRRAWFQAGESKPRWGRAIVAEVNPIGVFLILAVLSWNYDNGLMVRAIIVCLGISIVARALLPPESRNV